MKKCTPCLAEKPLTEYSKGNDRRDGLSYRCKDCAKATTLAWRQENTERARQAGKNWHAANKDQAKKRNAAWHKKNACTEEIKRKRSSYQAGRKQIRAALDREWQIANPDAVRAISARYRTRKRQSCPAWLTDDQKKEIKRIYAHAIDCQLVSGQKYHVDHIVPLAGKDVCGLHVPWNLQVLPDILNLKKGNKVVR